MWRLQEDKTGTRTDIHRSLQIHQEWIFSTSHGHKVELACTKAQTLCWIIKIWLGPQYKYCIQFTSPQFGKDISLGHWFTRIYMIQQILTDYIFFKWRLFSLLMRDLSTRSFCVSWTKWGIFTSSFILRGFTTVKCVVHQMSRHNVANFKSSTAKFTAILLLWKQYIYYE